MAKDWSKLLDYMKNETTGSDDINTIIKIMRDEYGLTLDTIQPHPGADNWFKVIFSKHTNTYKHNVSIIGIGNIVDCWIIQSITEDYEEYYEDGTSCSTSNYIYIPKCPFLNK